jgi:peptide/nickel transport system permease protein
MTAYITRRIFWLIPALFFVTVITFFIVRWVPGDAVDVIVAQLSQGGTVNIDAAAVRHMLHLDIPVWTQYWNWISGIILHGDFGHSLF